jgi:hypothetical protein
MTTLPILKAIEPLAQCDICGHKMYVDDKCRSAQPWKPPECPRNGEEWRRLVAEHAARS